MPESISTTPTPQNTDTTNPPQVKYETTRQFQQSNPTDRNSYPRLKNRIACIFKTGGNYFARTFLSTAIAMSAAGALVGGLLGMVGGAAIAAPVAGVVKLVEILAGKNSGYGQAILSGGVYIGCLLTGTITGRITGGIGVLAGIGLGLVAGGIGLARGAYDGLKGDVTRLCREENTLSDYWNSLPKPEDTLSEDLTKKPFGLARQYIVTTHGMLKHVVWP